MYKFYLKRWLDFAVSAVLIVLFCPLVIILAVITLVDICEWPFYSELRPGRHEKPFRILKLKTMKSLISRSERERITRYGAFLRRSSLDELPQLWNVLLGTMSLVGPRPLKISYLPYYTSEEKMRHEVRPGITGLAQVSGRNFLGWNERLRLDVEYVCHLSLKLDMIIMLRTLRAVAVAENVAAVPDEVEPDLDAVRK